MLNALRPQKLWNKNRTRSKIINGDRGKWRQQKKAIKHLWCLHLDVIMMQTYPINCTCSTPPSKLRNFFFKEQLVRDDKVERYHAYMKYFTLLKKKTPMYSGVLWTTLPTIVSWLSFQLQILCTTHTKLCNINYLLFHMLH